MHAIIELMHLETVKYDFNHPHSCDWRKKPRPYATMALMIEGTGKFVTQKETFIIKHGDMVFIPDGINYISYWQGNPNSYLSVHFMFESKFSQSEARNFKLQRLTGIDFDATLAALQNIRASLEKGGIGAIAATVDFFGFYSDVASRLKPAEHYGAAVKSVQKAIDYLENEDNDIHVGKLADMCYLSESRFFTLFKLATGMSPIKYKNNILIRRAAQMLKTGMSIQEVSDELGFSTPSYFRRTFKLATGKTPKEYMKSIYF